MEKYAEEVGGVFSFEEFDAIPYNHWKQDCDWNVIVLEGDEALFYLVEALTAREACTIAIKQHIYEKGDDDV